MSGSSYLKFPTELRSLKKGVINIKINDQKSFLCYHVRHINPVKINLERITQKDKELVNDLDLCDKKILTKLKRKTTLASMFLVMKTSCLFQSTSQIKNVKIPWICCL